MDQQRPITNITTTPEAAAVADIVRRHISPRLVELKLPDGKAIQTYLVPQGLELRSVKKFTDEYLHAPERRTGVAHVDDLGSFIAHVKRFADADSAIFADRDGKRLLAVLDYHRVGADGAPRFGTHRTEYAFPLSDEWNAWKGSNGRQMEQATFAEFLESRITDVVDPGVALETGRSILETLACKVASPSRLLELARGLTVRVGSIVRNAINLSTGETQMRFESQHQDESGAPLDVPGAFLIGIPVFRGGVRYQLTARLRYRHREGKLTWWYELYRAEETFDHAFGEAATTAGAATGLPVFAGTPEA